ncbi:MAG: diacylglycerol kinase family protein, partial [Solirubrobacteraceae bacterium]
MLLTAVARRECGLVHVVAGASALPRVRRQPRRVEQRAVGAQPQARCERRGGRVSDEPPRRLALIVNPSAGGGRALHALEGVERALESHRLEHHVEQTRSLEHARELALAAARAGEAA